MLEFVQVFLRRLASLFRRGVVSKTTWTRNCARTWRWLLNCTCEKAWPLRTPAARRVAASAALSKLRKLIATREDCP